MGGPKGNFDDSGGNQSASGGRIQPVNIIASNMHLRPTTLVRSLLPKEQDCHPWFVEFEATGLWSSETPMPMCFSHHLWVDRLAKEEFAPHCQLDDADDDRLILGDVALL